AREAYETARSEGRLAGLLDQERPNLFTQSVANVLPRARVDVVISYVQTLAYADGSYELVFPMVAGPRYVPRTKSKASAPGADSQVTAAKPSAGAGPSAAAARVAPAPLPSGVRAGHAASIEVSLDAGVPLVDVRSALHAVEVERTGESSATVRLADRAVVPNKDFVLRYGVAGGRIEDALL